MTQNLGKTGENLAKRFLEKAGFRIIQSNFKTKFGEIDLIGRSKEGILVFFEVKTMTKRGMSYSGLMPEDQVSESKMRKFKKIAQFYANNHSHLTERKGYRLDLITIILEDKLLPIITHYENI